MTGRMLPSDARPYFEDMIYMPMLITIITRDIEYLSGVKLKRPYINMLNNALELVQKDLKRAHDYMRQHKYKLEKGKVDDTFTEYLFLHNGYVDPMRYLNVRLRNRTEELLVYYFGKALR